MHDQVSTDAVDDLTHSSKDDENTVLSSPSPSPSTSAQSESHWPCSVGPSLQDELGPSSSRASSEAVIDIAMDPSSPEPVQAMSGSATPSRATSPDSLLLIDPSASIQAVSKQDHRSDPSISKEVNVEDTFDALSRSRATSTSSINFPVAIDPSPANQVESPDTIATPSLAQMSQNDPIREPINQSKSPDGTFEDKSVPMGLLVDIDTSPASEVGSSIASTSQVSPESSKDHPPKASRDDGTTSEYMIEDTSVPTSPFVAIDPSPAGRAGSQDTSPSLTAPETVHDASRVKSINDQSPTNVMVKGFWVPSPDDVAYSSKDIQPSHSLSARGFDFWHDTMSQNMSFFNSEEPISRLPRIDSQYSASSTSSASSHSPREFSHQIPGPTSLPIANFSSTVRNDVELVAPGLASSTQGSATSKERPGSQSRQVHDPDLLQSEDLPFFDATDKHFPVPKEAGSPYSCWSSHDRVDDLDHQAPVHVAAQKYSAIKLLVGVLPAILLAAFVHKGLPSWHSSSVVCIPPMTIATGLNDNDFAMPLLHTFPADASIPRCDLEKTPLSTSFHSIAISLENSCLGQSSPRVLRDGGANANLSAKIQRLATFFDGQAVLYAEEEIDKDPLNAEVLSQTKESTIQLYGRVVSSRKMSSRSYLPSFFPGMSSVREGVDECVEGFTTAIHLIDFVEQQHRLRMRKARRQEKDLTGEGREGDADYRDS